MQKFQFKTQAADLNKAVVALYEDGTSGGMVWNGPYNQTFVVHVWRRYRGRNNPWTRDYYAVKFTTDTYRPGRPPYLLNDVFYYEPDTKHLHVFWHHMYSLEFGDSDLTYIVRTDTR